MIRLFSGLQAALTRLSQVHDEIKYWLDWQLESERGACPHPASPRDHRAHRPQNGGTSRTRAGEEMKRRGRAQAHQAEEHQAQEPTPQATDHRRPRTYSHPLKQSPWPYTHKSAQSVDGDYDDGQDDNGDYQDTYINDYQHTLHPRTVPYSCTRSPSNASELTDSSDLTDSYPRWGRASSALDARPHAKHAGFMHPLSHHLDHESVTSQGKDELEQYLDEYGGYVHGAYVHSGIQARAAHTSIEARASHQYLDEYGASGAEHTRDRAGGGEQTSDYLEPISGAEHTRGEHTRDYLEHSSRQTLVPFRQQQGSLRAPQTFGESSRTSTRSDPRLTQVLPPSSSICWQPGLW